MMMLTLRPPSWPPYPFAGTDAGTGAGAASAAAGAVGAAVGAAVGGAGDDGHRGGTVGCVTD